MARRLEAETADQPIKVISKKALRDLVGEAETLKGKISGLSGSLGEKIAEAAESKNLHPAVFRLMLTLRKKDPVKLRYYLDAFDYYRDVLNLDDAKASLFEDADEPVVKQMNGEDDEQEERLAHVGRGRKANAEAH